MPPLEPSIATSRKAPGRPIDLNLNDAIREATINLLGEGGYAALTMAKIAKAAGVSTASLYRRWDNKAELMKWLAVRVMTEATLYRDTGSLYGDLVHVIKSRVTVLNGKTGTVGKILFGEAATNPELAKLIESCSRLSTRHGFDQALSNAIARGEITADHDFELVIDMFMGPLMLRHMLYADGLDSMKPHYIEELVQYYVRALAATPATGTPGAGKP